MARKSARKRPSTVANSVATAPESETPGQSRHASHSKQTWKSGVALPALVSALALWAAAAPLGWGWLAWLAPMGWLLICERPTSVGGRGYWLLWLSGCLFWLLTLQGVRLAYWPLIFGWLAISMYLAVYVPIFVLATRALRWGWGWPLVWAAPTVWVGLEHIRSYLFTGFAANTLAHTQAHYPLVIQIADQFGSGGISFVMMTVAAASLPGLRALVAKFSAGPQAAAPGSQTAFPGPSPAWGGLVWALCLLTVVCGYGWWRLAQADSRQAAAAPLMRVLLVQENTPSMFDNYSPERSQQAWNDYLMMTRSGAAEHGPIDLVVWPESTFTGTTPWVEQYLQDDLPDELQREEVGRERLLAWISDLELAFQSKANLVLEGVRYEVQNSQRPLEAEDPRPLQASTSEPEWPYLLVGCDVLVYRSDKVERFNSALFVGPSGEMLDRYGKRHLVMFGEYIPLGPLLQWLRDLVGLQGMDAGTEAKSFKAGAVQVAPNICFESMMPHVISAQVRELSARGEAPDVLVNITNDSWFRGSSILDHHLACSMLCAVENRRPLLVAANTGLSAHIDGCGRLVECSQRSQAAVVLAEPRADGRGGLVQLVGYPFLWLCAAVSLWAVGSAIFWRRTSSPECATQ
jgi:apolipoprotein N-acyltransferase